MKTIKQQSLFHRDTQRTDHKLYVERDKEQAQQWQKPNIIQISFFGWEEGAKIRNKK